MSVRLARCSQWMPSIWHRPALPPSGETPTSESWFDTNNRLTGVGYDPAGNQKSLGASRSNYNAENRQTTTTLNSVTAQYAYDGDGRRVKKVSGGVTTVYVYDAQGRLAAEYTTAAGTQQLCTTCYLTADALGSTRLVSDGHAAVTKRYDYRPFGQDIPVGIGDRTTSLGYGVADPTTIRFTGKERDTETVSSATEGLDYFGARYFSGAQGRWNSPDRMNVTEDRLLVPSSTLNKYAYAANNPLRFKDLDGRDVVALFEPPHGVRPGHFAMLAYNQATGDSAFMSFGPTDRSLSGQILTAVGGTMGSTTSFALPQSADELRRDYAALSVQTTPEQAQDIIAFFRQFSTTDDPYRLFRTNCTTVCRDALKAIGILPRDFGSITPLGLWTYLWQRQSRAALDFAQWNRKMGFNYTFDLAPTRKAGVDYGSPRFGMDTFDFLMLMLRQPKACVEVSDSATGTKSKQCE